MIVFDLQCIGSSHVFEGWFATSDAFEDQRARGLLICPLCGDTDIKKAVMAPNVSTKGNQLAIPAPSHPVATDPASAREIKTALAKLAAVQAKLLAGSTWVGVDFNSKARAMEAGDIATTPIHGQATLSEAKALVDDGIAITALPLPVIPPDQYN